MMRCLSCLILAACAGAAKGDEATVTAYTVKGVVKFTPLNAPTGARFGGPIHVVLFNNTDEGYCLTGPAAFASVKFNAIAAGDAAALAGAGMTFELPVPEAPGQTYPFAIYPTAVWQATQRITNACEVDPAGGADLYNARGYFGVAPGSPATSLCCGSRAQALTVTQRGQVFEDVEIVMVPEQRLTQSCKAAGAPYDACELRHAPPPNQSQDSACWTALGANAAALIKASDGSACP